MKFTLVRIRSNGFLNINKLQKPQWNTQSNKIVSIQHRNILKFFLIPHPRRPQMTRWKHCRMTHLIQAQGKNQPNQ